MSAFLALHALAARRGDGLRPTLLALMQTRALIAEATVADLALLRPDQHIQAGPHPVGAVAEELPENILRFPQPDRSSRVARKSATGI